MKILVTGGAGYIGSHTVAELLLAGLEVVVLDNYSNSSACALARVAAIVEGETDTPAPLLVIEGDVRDRALLDRLFAQHDIGGVIHFAGLKAVGESMAQPLEYYENNVGGSVTLCQAMAAAGVTRLVFSSSATVYGEEAPVPYVETQPRGRTSNPYGTSKAMFEQILTDLCASNPHWSVALLRYFNPIGAHPSGRIGEDPQGIPNNLMPYIAQVAIGRRDALSIFGNDYSTPDGTCRRDYLHVVDLAKGHLRALESLGQPGIEAYNLGTGQAYSVLEMVQAFEQASDRPVPYHFAPRRPGDLPAFWANPEKADRVLNWRAERSLDDMMADTWRWQAMNPQGYRS